MQMNRLSLSFADPELEQAYRSERLPIAVRHNRISAVVGALTILCFLFAGMITRSELIEAVMPYRLGSLAICVLMILTCHLDFLQRDHDLFISLGTFLLWLVLWPLTIPVFPIELVQIYNLPSTMLFVVAIFSLLDLRLPYRIGVTAAVTVLAFVQLSMYRPSGEIWYLAFDLAHHGSAVMVGLVGAWLMERYRRMDFVHAREAQAERAKSERLLLNILPEAIARQLRDEHRALADGFEEVTVLFSDIVGFTPLSERLPPESVVRLLNRVFSEFDTLADKHGLEKIKTIGDAYMVAGGLPERSADHAEVVARMALEMQQVMGSFAAELGEPLELRIGINTGPVVAGVIGRKKFIYDLWGDTVNTASRMESHGTPGRIQVTEAVRARLAGRFDFEPRGEIEVKGKGAMEVYYLVGERPPVGGAELAATF